MIPRILPGQSKTWSWPLRTRFGISEPGTYTFSCTLRGAFLPDEQETEPASMKDARRYVLRTEPFRFHIQAPFWKERRTLEFSRVINQPVREIIFQATELGEHLSLSVYRVTWQPRGESYGAFQRIGELKNKESLPEVREYAESRFGFKYPSPRGEKCALIRFGRSAFDWVQLDLAGEGDWPPWPDEEAWRKLIHPTGGEAGEYGGPREPDGSSHRPGQ